MKRCSAGKQYVKRMRKSKIKTPKFTEDEYNEILKRVEEREKGNQSQLKIPYTKVYYGGSISPK
ncbi:hypothetical protein [Neobacillus drentensis]|uniref:hypothetical protein n=1 Tax=Neobacillus drentensis TaxID=220684 RepID=UPI002860A3E4|nr:hypothetical protein [Neobacillus drentensis]MDR7240493.1 putative solute-binding protein [Neobacillus drentensis]